MKGEEAWQFATRAVTVNGVVCVRLSDARKVIAE